jgi:hypothetical protein
VWNELSGKWSYQTGTAGPVTIPAGNMVVRIIVSATAGSATVSILGGGNIPVIANAPPMVIDFQHLLVQANRAQNTIVFTNTASYYVEQVAATPAG